MRRFWILVFACAAWLPCRSFAKTKSVEVSATPPAIAPSVAKATAAIQADAAWLLRTFRELHEDSQVGRIEARLAGTVASELAGRGFDVVFGADGTEVVATLRNGPGPVLVYRVDTGSDSIALPARRSSPAAWGALPLPHHRCGHDASIAWMLGMAKALVALRDEWAGTLVLVSQPTRLLQNGEPTLAKAGAEGRRMPTADMVLALSAAPSPLGSILSVRGQRRAGSETADLVMSRVGVYDVPRHREAVNQLAASTARLYGLPADTIFGYVLVGIADRALGESLAGDLAATLEDGAAAGDVDLAAIPLGTRLATVAVLELLEKPQAARGQRSDPPPATPARRAAPGRAWTRHDD